MHNRMPTRSDGERWQFSRESQSTTFQQVVRHIRSNLVIFCTGIFLLLVAAVLLFWNEGRAVQSAHSLDEATSVVITLSSDTVASENNDRLVHISGPLRTRLALHDDMYGISVHAVKLKRIVELYQWVEHEHRREVQELERIRTDITYSYSTEWKTDLIDSDSFDIRPGHYNPKSRPVEPTELTAERVQIGNFYLSSNLIGKINNYKQLVPSQVPANNLSHLQLYEGAFYHSQSPLHPQVGDVRVTFEYAGFSGEGHHSQFGEPDIVSVIGRQDSHSFITSYWTKSGDKIELLYVGQHSAQAMFASERASNALLTWALRFLGWLLMFLGFGCTSAIVTVFVDWLPVIRDMVHLGINSLNALLAISGSLLVIACGWLWYRPLLGCFILCMAVLPHLLLSRTPHQNTYRTDYRER